MDLEAINERIAEVHRGRKWIVVGDTGVGSAPVVDQLREWGAESVMVVAAGEGVGELPDADRIHYTRATGGGTGGVVMSGIRANIAAIERPSAELEAAVAKFDPDGEAMVLGAGFSRAPTLLGRAIYGLRPPSWGDLEDKMVIDELADAAGIARAPSRIVSVADAPAAARALAGELGTVWVADNTEGWHGGGEYVRWVRDPQDVGPAVEWFGAHASRVRVMPFLEGVPCSIHGFNTADGTAVFSPVEMLILRHAERPEFVYARAANFWNPPQAIRDQMRQAARSMGVLLTDRVRYLGSFGVDGVATAEGFLPTELNPRFSVGHGLQSNSANVPLDAIERLVVAGDLEVSATDLEETIETAVTHARAGVVIFFVGGDHQEPKTGLVFTESGAIQVDADERNDATMEIGPGPYGPVIVVRFHPERTPIGPRAAGKALQALAAAKELWGVDIPPMVAAPDRVLEDGLE
jgi:hypothetical protein